VLYAPTISYGVVVPLLANTSTRYAPSVVYGITAPLLTSSSIPYQPTVFAGTAVLVVPTLYNTSVLYTPTCGFTKEPSGYVVQHKESSHVLQHTQLDNYVRSRVIIIL